MITIDPKIFKMSLGGNISWRLPIFYVCVFSVFQTHLLIYWKRKNHTSTTLQKKIFLKLFIKALKSVSAFFQNIYQN